MHAKLLGNRKNIELLSQELEVPSEMATELATAPDAGLYFDWGPESLRYHQHIERKPPTMLSDGPLELGPPNLDTLMEAMGLRGGSK